MALIKYTQFIGIRAAENTVFNTTYNSTNYSMLVVFMDGTASIVEGDAKAMAPYLPFLKEDNMEQVLRDALAQMEKNLEKMVDTRIERIFAVNHPIPDVIGMREDEAVTKLTAAGFTVKFANTYPEGLPQGVVKDYHRENDNYLTVLLDVRHELPNVVGMPADEALLRLRNLGFRVKLVNGEPARGKVFACTRADDRRMDVSLDVRLEMPNVEGMSAERAIPLLKNLGFRVQLVNGEPARGKVFACTRASERSLDVSLDVRLEMPDIIGKPEQEALELLRVEGFRVKTTHLDPFDIDSEVISVQRPDPRGEDVVLMIASHDFNIMGMDTDAAKQKIESAGLNVAMERKASLRSEFGKVVEWEKNGNTVMLYVGSGQMQDDKTAIATNYNILDQDGADMESRNISTVYSWADGSLTISMEVCHHSKNRLVFDDAVEGWVEGQSCEYTTFTVSGGAMDPLRWYPAVLRFAGLDSARLPQGVKAKVVSTYGLFKKQTAWNMDFDFKWYR